MHKKKSTHPLATIALVGAILFFFTSGAILLWASTLEIPDLSTFNERKIAQSTKIYDRTGKVLLYDLHENIQRTLIPINEVSVHIKNATVAIEDAEFYEHKGIKVSSIIRAVLVNVGTLGYAQGGSTITQQVVKNSILTKDKTITRKIKEWILALKLEQILTKERILELYLNESPYGGNIYGIEEAAQTFFNKQAKDITLGEAAYLAALPQAPTYYSPYGNNKEKLEDRKNLVLKRMRDLQFITDEDFTEASAFVPKFAAQRVQKISAPHFVFYVREYLEEKYGKSAIEEDGFRVITTLDANLQAQAEAVVREYAYENETKFKASNAALVATDPKTGEILVMVGSRDYFDKAIDGNFNIALAKRQPGSSFKPIVYAAAFEKGLTPETMVFDLETQFSTSCRYDDFSSTPPCYSPVNYDNVYRGPVSFRDALAQSINVPAVKALYLVGINKAIELAKDMGITTLTNASQYGLTLVLGGGEVTLLDMTSAYGVFANGGERIAPRSILRIEDRQGTLIEETAPVRTRVLEEQTALQISDVLSDNDARSPAFGHSSALHFPNDAVAVKTGTTNDYKDVWIIGYTPNIVVGAWSGNNDNTPMEKKVAGFIVAPLWNAFMQKAIAVRPKETFKKPLATPDTVPPMLRGEWQGGESYTIDTMSGKLATEFTPKETQQKRVVFDVHSILHWVDKNNPRGPKPANPGEDAQYMHWEYPVQLWKLTQGIKEGDRSWIPTGYDTVHTAASAPKASIVNPLSDTTHTLSTPLTISVQATGTYALTKADFFINGIQVGSSNRFPFSHTTTPGEQGITAGPATVSVVVYDGMFNRTEVTSTILFTE